MDNELDHPCKNTCSGWKQGYDRGARKADEDLKKALALDISLKQAVESASKEGLRPEIAFAVFHTKRRFSGEISELRSKLESAIAVLKLISMEESRPGGSRPPSAVLASEFISEISRK